MLVGALDQDLTKESIHPASSSQQGFKYGLWDPLWDPQQVAHRFLTVHSSMNQTHVTPRAHAIAHLAVFDGLHMMMRHVKVHLLTDFKQCIRLS